MDEHEECQAPRENRVTVILSSEDMEDLKRLAGSLRVGLGTYLRMAFRLMPHERIEALVRDGEDPKREG